MDLLEGSGVAKAVSPFIVGFVCVAIPQNVIAVLVVPSGVAVHNWSRAMP